MTGFYQGNDPQVDYGAAESWASLSKDWAIKLVDPVEGTSYSALYHANNAQVLSTAAESSAASASASAQAAADALNDIENLTLGQLANVTITDPQDGDVLSYDSASGTWQNGPAAVAQNVQIATLLTRVQAVITKLNELGIEV